MTQKPESPAKPVSQKAETPVSVVATPQDAAAQKPVAPELAKEFGGRKGPEATRYGDWEMNGKCVDF